MAALCQTALATAFQTRWLTARNPSFSSHTRVTHANLANSLLETNKNEDPQQGIVAANDKVSDAELEVENAKALLKEATHKYEALQLEYSKAAKFAKRWWVVPFSGRWQAIVQGEVDLARRDLQRARDDLQRAKNDLKSAQREAKRNERVLVRVRTTTGVTPTEFSRVEFEKARKSKVFIKYDPNSNTEREIYVFDALVANEEYVVDTKSTVEDTIEQIRKELTN